jgi:hypothetical protein
MGRLSPSETPTRSVALLTEAGAEPRAGHADEAAANCFTAPTKPSLFGRLLLS